MTNEQESYLNMQLTTAKFCTENTSAVNALPAYSANLQTLIDVNRQIQDISGFQGTGTSGITSNKKQLRLNLNASGSDTARKLTSFAKLTDNYALLPEVDFSESDFKSFSDIDAKDKAQNILNKAQEHLNELGVYGLNTATQLRLQNAITAFSEVIVAPRIGKTSQSQATMQLSAFFKTAATALEKMDVAVEIVKLTEPVFYSGYKSARKVIRKGTGKLAVKGMVTESDTDKPLKGVTVTFTPDSTTQKLSAASSEGQAELSKITAAKGGFNIKSIPAGTYKASFKKVGYAEQVITVNVNDGEITVVEVKLNKV